MNDEYHLRELDRRLAVVRDRVRSVANGFHTGLYLYGRPGTSKTYTVRTTLEDLEVPYHYHSGHCTPLGLFDVLGDNHDRVVVLDDISQIFQQSIAVQILLAALGSTHDGVRTIKYKRSGSFEVVRFTGGIICISNLELNGKEVLGALKSRIHCLNYNPTDEQMAALLRKIASQDLVTEHGVILAGEATVVAAHVLAECERLNYRPDIRLLVDKALKDFLLHKIEEAETDWRDLVTSSIHEALIELRYPVRSISTRNERKSAEVQLLERLIADLESRSDQINAWTTATGKSERAFYRRLRETNQQSLACATN